MCTEKFPPNLVIQKANDKDLNIDLFPKTGYIRHEKTMYVGVGIKLAHKMEKKVFNLINNQENVKHRNSQEKVVFFFKNLKY